MTIRLSRSQIELEFVSSLTISEIWVCGYVLCFSSSSTELACAVSTDLAETVDTACPLLFCCCIGCYVVPLRLKI
ncbi:hypothetical protein K7X08_016322 [Anisodus acutangulus]|uniref:Uncharacterized protein n=1 Tax=Anisodus acutangulus TaxID=402998 RepID=A0A9Q1LDH0_9SOLA|nr:hypothetical protein K7X08_016322 [Anisodus acutangulus]